MKLGKIAILTVSTGLMFGLMNGCGGGSSDDSSVVSSDVSLVELTPEVAEKMVISASDALGCSYTSETVVTSSKYLDLVNKSASIKEVIEISKDIVPVLAVEPVSETIVGTCPTNPGSLTISGTHEDGVDDLTYTYNSFCTGDDVENVTFDGIAYIKNVGIPSDTGPIPQYRTISTGNDGITTIEKSPEGTYTRVEKVSDLKYTYGDTTAESPTILTIGSLNVVDGKTNKTYDVSNVDLSTYESGTNEVVTINSITYTDPVNGTVNINSTGITSNEDEVILSGEITIMGSNDTSVTLSPYPSVQNAFALEMDGKTIGVMDCSATTTL